MSNRHQLVWLTASFVIAVILGLTSPVRAGTYVKDEIVNHTIFTQNYYLQAGNVYAWEAQDLKQDGSGSYSPDTVMRLLKENSSTEQVQHHHYSEYAADDDGGSGLASAIYWFYPPETGWYRLVVHSYSTQSSGTMDLWFNGQKQYDDVPFGGLRYTFSVGPGEEIRTLFAPGGSYGHQLLVADGYGASSLARWQDARMSGSSVNELAGLSYENPDASANFYVVYASANYFMEWDQSKIMYNPTSVDTDGDGLSDAVEDEVNTCKSSSQTLLGWWDCGKYYASDTDNDGLGDFEELAGDFTTSCTWWGCPATQAAPLPLWGAFPNHKDVFVEADWDPNSIGPSGPGADLEHPDWRDGVHDIYDDPDPYDVENPDLENGIALHIDSAGLTTTHGYSDNPVFLFDGGGSNAIPGDTVCYLHGFIPANTGDLLFLNGNPDQIYRYEGSWYDDGVRKGTKLEITGTQNNDGSYTVDQVDSAEMVTLVATDSVVGAIETPSSVDAYPPSLLCECRKALTTTHQTPLRQKYIHYACLHDEGGGQATTPGRTLQADITEPGAFAHELGHNFGLSHGGGHVYNGIPQFLSTMNYVYAYQSGLGFSSGQYIGHPLNPTHLSEAAGIGGDDAFLTQYPWYYTLFSGDGVDWNRNGVLDSGYVRAAITWAPWKGTNAQARNGDIVSDPSFQVNPNNTPSLVRLSSGADSPESLYVFYTVGDDTTSDLLRYRQLTVNPDGTCVNADKPSDPRNTPCGTWSAARSGAWYADGISGTDWREDSRPREVYLAVRRPNDELWIIRASPYSDGSLNTSTVIKKFTGADAKGDPDIASNAYYLHVVWRDSNDELWQARMYRGGGWYGPVRVGNYTSGNDPTIIYNPGTTSGSLARTNTADKIVLLKNSVFGSTSWTLDTAHNQALPKAYYTTEKVGLAWHPVDSVSDPYGPGFLLLAYVRNSRKPWLLYFGPGNFREGYMGNDWLKARTGVDYLWHDGDANLQATLVTSGSKKLFYFPYADGIFDYELKDTNEFLRMATGLCDSFPGGTECNVPPCPGCLIQPIDREDVSCFEESYASY